jgi:hypothetical protein
MLTGPIFSQEEEEEMMNLSEFRERPGVNESQEHSRGTVILEGDDEEEVEAQGEEVGTEDFATPPNVIPQDYSREGYEFSFDFSAPTHVYSLQFNPPGSEQNSHDDDTVKDNRETSASFRGYLKKNMLFCWVVVIVFVVLCGVQQLVLVKNDLARLRFENEQLKLTVETLQQREESTNNHSKSDEYLFYKMFEHGFPAEATSKLGECATEAKNQLYHHIADLKESFWMTAEHIRDVIEDEIIGKAPKEAEKATKGPNGKSALEKWNHKNGLKETVNKTFKQIGGAKVVLPVLLISGATMAVEWFWGNDD